MSQSEKERKIAIKACNAYRDKLDLKIGDIVKVIFKVPNNRQCSGWSSRWEMEMDEFIGLESEVLLYAQDGNSVKLQCGNKWWFFPVFCLEVVSRKADEPPEEDLKKTIRSLEQKLVDVYAAGQEGISEVGHANYHDRIEKAEKALDKAMYPDDQEDE